MSVLRMGFWIDPLESLQIGHDSTFALIKEARRRGHDVFCFEQQDVVFDGGEVRARMCRLDVLPQKPWYTIQSVETLPVSALDALFLRKDPPFDGEYLHVTQMVELCGEQMPFCVNAPSGLRAANEKLFGLRFPELMPKTWVGTDMQSLRDFVDAQGGKAVVKPVDGFAGRGVFFLSRSDPNFNALIEQVTVRGTERVVAQAYIPECKEGDKRILLLDGEPLGAVLRLANQKDWRCNFAAGGKGVKTALTARDREICERLKPALQALGLFFVGIDVIGPYLTEVNVTSPTGLLEMNALDGTQLERLIIDFVESRVTGS